MQEVPNYMKAQGYAADLDASGYDDEGLKLEIAEVYVRSATALKNRVELDPLRELVRRQDYKELAGKAITTLRGLGVRTHEYNHLLALAHYAKWEYDDALRYVDQAIAIVPDRSAASSSYHRFRREILDKRRRFS
jgi:hypothetical protein